MSISEQVKHLKELSDTARANVYSFEALSQSLREAADTIESLSAKLQAANMERSSDCGGWISCKERLPENRQKVLVSRNGETLENVFEFHIPDEEDYEGEYGDTIRGYFFSECDAVVGIYSDDTISVAWKPLPEPYHEP